LISDLNAGGLIHATLDGGGTMGTLLFLPGINTLHTFTFTRTPVNDEPNDDDLGVRFTASLSHVVL
jgi:hypothetical protein